MDQRSLIKKILLCFEQSSSIIKYGDVYKYADGPKGIRQITLSFGITEYGNLKLLLMDYCGKKGKFADKFLPYISKLGKVPLVDDVDFVNLLKASAIDPVMQMCQERAYDNMYIYPAEEFCDRNNLKYNLSKLVICDSYLHSGSILPVIRNMFPAKISDETLWISQYCAARKEWLANHSRAILHNTTYRMDFMLECIEAGDWNMTRPSYLANDVRLANV